LQSLHEAGYGWLYEMLFAFNSGNIPTFQTLFERNASSNELLAKNVQFLNQKIRILALMELVFSRRSDDRNLTFGEVSHHCNLPVDQVELLAMKALSLKLIQGQIDQVDQIVRVQWVQPRVLDQGQITQLKNRMEGWIDSVHKTALFLEESAPDVFSQQMTI
jgi:26S proteasome regulatory subunit N9